MAVRVKREKLEQKAAPLMRHLHQEGLRALCGYAFPLQMNYQAYIKQVGPPETNECHVCQEIFDGLVASGTYGRNGQPL